jgi:PPOX class probable F420-dependent enzyme
MVKMDEAVRELLEQPVLYNLATVNPNGTVQLNPVWGHLRGDMILLNTAAGRQKHKNLAERGDQVTVMVVDPADPYRYVEIRGEVDGMTDEDGVEVIDQLATKYTGADRYAGHKADETRVTITLRPTKIFVH